jgi:hypothetical protein
VLTTSGAKPRRVDVEVRKQKFRTNMSIIFTVLVGMVIVGFYVLAGTDEPLCREMFSCFPLRPALTSLSPLDRAPRSRPESSGQFPAIFF